MSVATAIAGLRPSAPEPLPFDRSLHIRAFVLERRQGDVLVYSTSGVEADGVSRQYLNHGHEAMFLSDAVNVPLFVHEADRAAVPRRVRGTFSRRHTLDDDFEVIPTPGTRRERPRTCGTTARSACCSPATASTCATASGSARCWAPATARPTSTASS